MLQRLRAEGGLASIGVAVGFGLLASLILLTREDVVRYRPGQWVNHDLVSRVDFSFRDDQKLTDERERVRNNTPRVYRFAEHDPWKAVEDDLLTLPDRVKTLTLAELPAELKPPVLDEGALTVLQNASATPAERERYNALVKSYVEKLRGLDLIIIPEDQQRADLGSYIRLEGVPDPRPAGLTFTPKSREVIDARVTRQAEQSAFPRGLTNKVVTLTLRHLAPTHVLDDAATTAARNLAAAEVPHSAGDVVKKANQTLVDVEPGGGKITEDHWLLLKAENEAYLRTLGPARWFQRGGLFGMVVLMTVVASLYVARYQQRIVRNHARAAAIAGLLLAMLLLAQLAALGTNSIYFFGVAPTILVAMILTIAYDHRFALAMSFFHAALVTLALDAPLSFLAILACGVVSCCFLMDDLRTRSKLIEVGGLSAVAMILTALAAGLINFDPIPYIARSSLYVGAAGLAVGFVVLGILPFIEKLFKITTSMTLLELADPSQPLLRRLSLEAPGTYNHSFQVATLAEEAAEAIGGNALLCRVAAYYHDVGKINKAEYFAENQTDGQNRHINLSPNVSLLIIIGHVKDGIELAKEYNLPTSLLPFIQQHHGTTVVECFFDKACDKAAPDQPEVPEEQYRYPGPKPKTKEIAILMLSDAVESACRAMRDPTASRIEALVHEIALKRLHDGQFDECDLTMRDLDRIERSLVKSLLGIYHGRIAYASTSSITAAPAATTDQPVAKTA
jgi:putative nucleotidyltransferase with HDIG domain